MEISKFYFALAAACILFSCTDNIIGGDDEDDTPDYEFDKVSVLEYSPAPGQFINEFHVPTNAADAARWAQKAIDSRDYVSLGAFGGYIVLKPSVSIANVDGYDFGIAGNPIATQNEPGIVWVMQDANGNGLPDDTWYELKGSATPKRNYTVTYSRTTTPGDIPWEDSEGKTGFVFHNPDFHTQNYYPVWCDKDGKITLTGTLLQAQPVDNDGELGNEAYGWGYVDNLGSDIYKNEYDRYVFNRFDISNAIDQSGNRVTLPKVDFIKVQSAVLYDLKHLGEVSTEVAGFVLLKD